MDPSTAPDESQHNDTGSTPGADDIETAPTQGAPVEAEPTEAPAPTEPAAEAEPAESPAPTESAAEAEPAAEVVAPAGAGELDDHDEDHDDEDAVEPGEVEPNPEAIPPVEAVPPAEAMPPAEAQAEPAARGEQKGARSKPKPAPKKPAGPDPAAVIKRIGTSNEAALRYVLSPDPSLTRLSRKVRESLITDVPPVTAGALLGPAALARHFVASAAAGRYRDLFSLWELFRIRPDEVKPVLAERQRALERAREMLSKAARLGMGGRAERVAEDIASAQGLIWTWLREIVTADLAAVGRRPQIATALLEREPGLDIPLPDKPTDSWLAEAASVRQAKPVPAGVDALLSAHIDRLPATVATLSLTAEHYPERLPALLDRVDLDRDDIGSIMAWARDHGMGDRLRERIRESVEAASGDRAQGLARWQFWRERGVDLPLPDALRTPTIEGLDLARPESAHLIAGLVSDGVSIDPQGELDALATRNRQLAEKAYEAFVCAELDVHLPLALEGNPIVRDGTRCPSCQAWTWVRPGHEQRCPRRREEELARA
ncbi:hypothetical protein BH20ACT7_BH20ACT7_09050 [soil metagenome]